MTSNKFVVEFDSNIFSKDAILNACYDKLENYYFDIKTEGDVINVFWHLKLGDSIDSIDSEIMNKELKNLAIDHMLRIKIRNETKNIRETLIYSALIESRRNG